VRFCPLGRDGWRGCENIGEFHGDGVCLEDSIIEKVKSGEISDGTCPLWLQEIISQKEVELLQITFGIS